MLPILCVTESQNEKKRLEAEEPLKPLPKIDPEPFIWRTASLPYCSLVFLSWYAASSKAFFHEISSNSPDPRGPIRFKGVVTLSGACKLLRRALPFTHGINRGLVGESVLFTGVSIRIIFPSCTYACNSHRHPQLKVQVNGIFLISCIQVMPHENLLIKYTIQLSEDKIIDYCLSMSAIALVGHVLTHNPHPKHNSGLYDNDPLTISLAPN